MASVYRRSYWTTIKGKRLHRKSRKYTIEYKDAAGIRRTVSAYTDREASRQFAARLEREAARGIERLTDPYALQARRPLLEHLDEYVADLETAKRSPMYCYNVEKRMAKLFATCNWCTLADVDPNGFIAWRVERGRMDAAPRTMNQYLETARGFLGWCVRNKRLATDPLSCISKVDARGDIRRRRRGLAPDKLDALLAVSEQRALCYLTVTYTGLRRNECRRLQWGDVRLDHAPPYLLLRAATTKGKREDVQPLRADLADALRAARPANARPTDPVFPVVPGMDVYRRDLAAAGIPYLDDEGRQADFHALRLTFNMLLAQANVPPRTAMELMRHTDIKLTMGAYTDPRLLDTTGAVESLPALGRGTDRQGAVLRATGTDNSDAEPRELQGPLQYELQGTADSDCHGLAPTGTRTHADAGSSDTRKSNPKGSLGTQCHPMAPHVTKEVLESKKTGELGFEPRLTEPESVVLPLHYSPLWSRSVSERTAPQR